MIASLKRGDAESAAAVGEPPALFTAMSSRPWAATTSVDERVHLLRVADIADPERRGRWRSGAFRPHTTTVAPASASRSAMAAPMPLVPPVTRATCPLRSRTTAIGGRCTRPGGRR